MKKIVALILSAALSAAMLAGCGGAPNSSSSSSGSSSQPSSSEPSAVDSLLEGVEIKSGGKLEKILADGKITLVTSPDYAPYEFIDLSKMGQGQEQYVGADVELAKYVAQQRGVELVIEAQDYDSVLAAATEGKTDMAISGIVAREDRKTAMDFTSTYNPPEANSQSVMIRAEDADKYKDN